MYYVCIGPIHCLKGVSYYDLSVLSMSVMGFQKKVSMGWVSGVSSIQVYSGFWNNFINLAKPLTLCVFSNSNDTI